MKKSMFLLFIFLLFLIPAQFSQAALFAPADTAVSIGTHLDRGYEPSGIIWHERLQSLFLVWDNGYVTQMGLDGTILHPSVFVGGDLEGITLVDEKEDFLYLLVEYPPKIVEFDLKEWKITKNAWTLQGMPGNSKSGAEALTFHRAQNVFYVGSQFDGNIYAYTIDRSVSGEGINPRIIHTGINSDLAGLHYSQETGRTYALFDDSNIVQEYDASDTRVAQFDVPGINQEGLTLLPGCPNNTTTIVIAEDSGDVKTYGGYPISCPIPAPVDQDQDGVDVASDCDDTNALLSPNLNEVVNDGLNNDCNAQTPDWSETYRSSTLTAYRGTEIRADLHVFDSKGEFSYVKMPAQPVDGWYRFELDAKATTIDQRFDLGVYVRNAQERFTQTREIQSVDFQPYVFYHYIPANLQTEVRFVSGVRGSDANGTKREHHLRAVTIERVQEPLDPLNLPVVSTMSSRVSQHRVSITAAYTQEASTLMTLNGVSSMNTTLQTGKTWQFSNLACGTSYPYELKLYTDLYSLMLSNIVRQTGTITTAPCL